MKSIENNLNENSLGNKNLSENSQKLLGYETNICGVNILFNEKKVEDLFCHQRDDAYQRFMYNFSNENEFNPDLMEEEVPENEHPFITIQYGKKRCPLITNLLKDFEKNKPLVHRDLMRFDELEIDKKVMGFCLDWKEILRKKENFSDEREYFAQLDKERYEIAKDSLKKYNGVDCSSLGIPDEISNRLYAYPYDKKEFFNLYKSLAKEQSEIQMRNIGSCYFGGDVEKATKIISAHIKRALGV